MSTTLPADLSCPRCGAHVRAGSDWCTLCYTDLRPAEQRPPSEPPAAPAAEVAVDVSASASPTAVAATPAAPVALTSETTPEQQARGRRGKHAKPAPRDEDAGEAEGAREAVPAETEVLAAQLLAQLAVHEGGSSLGRFGTLIDTPGKKVGVMLGGAAAVMLLLFTLMTLFGVLV